MPTLYEDLVAAGLEVSNWQSDLYVPATEEAKAIFRKHGQKLLYFKSNINGKFMLEAHSSSTRTGRRGACDDSLRIRWVKFTADEQ